MAAAVNHPAQRRHQNPGLAAIARHHRDGALHGVHVIGHSESSGSRKRSSHPLTNAVRSAEPGEHDDVIGSGSLLVHVRNPRHRQRLHDALKSDPHIRHVERVPVRYIWASRQGRGLEDIDALFPTVRMWNLRSIRLQQARANPNFQEANRISVALLDSGVDEEHPALRGRIHEYVTHYRGLPPLRRRDLVGHGTHIAGVIAGSNEGELSGGGICRCRLTVYKIVDDRTEAEYGRLRLFTVDPTRYLRALHMCVRERHQVINLSLGGPARPSQEEAEVLRRLVANDSIVVVAMGNPSGGNPYALSYPAASPDMIAVGAVGPSDAPLPFSRRGKHITVTAPGISIWSTLPTYAGRWGRQLERREWHPIWRNRYFDAWPGTSVACPHVTGAVALLIAKCGRMPVRDVRQRLMDTADNTPGMRRKRFSPTFGAGRLNVAKLLGR